MPPKKFHGVIYPTMSLLKKKKDETNGRWIECSLCCLVIKVRATFGFTEWVNHCAPARHCQLVADQDDTRVMHKLTSYFDTKKDKSKFTSC